MTIPTLISNYKEMILISQIRKSYSLMKNATMLAEVDNGSYSIWPIKEAINMESYFETYYKPYFKGAQLCDSMIDCGYDENLNNKKWTNDSLNWGLFTSDTRILFRVADGSVFFIPRNSTEINSDGSTKVVYANEIFIDVNGPKGPNTGGMDVIFFERSKNGIIAPANYLCTETFAKGCLNKIITNGWKFPDDYPIKF